MFQIPFLLLKLVKILDSIKFFLSCLFSTRRCSSSISNPLVPTASAFDYVLVHRLGNYKVGNYEKTWHLPQRDDDDQLAAAAAAKGQAQKRADLMPGD